MKKIINYIRKGKGIGALWLLAFSALIAFYSAYYMNKNLHFAVPYVQEFADKVLPLKVENHKLVVPENTVKTFTEKYAGKPFSFVIDTTKDMLETKDLTDGVYFTRSYVYSITNQEVTRKQLIENFDLPKQDYTDVMNLFIRWLTIAIALVGPFFNFLFFLIAVLFYAFFNGFACVLNKVSLNFKTKMRLNTLLFIGVYVLSYLFYAFGVNFSMLAFFLVMIALQIISVKKIATPETVQMKKIAEPEKTATAKAAKPEKKTVAKTAKPKKETAKKVTKPKAKSAGKKK